MHQKKVQLSQDPCPNNIYNWTFFDLLHKLHTAPSTLKSHYKFRTYNTPIPSRGGNHFPVHSFRFLFTNHTLNPKHSGYGTPETHERFFFQPIGELGHICPTCSGSVNHLPPFLHAIRPTRQRLLHHLLAFHVSIVFLYSHVAIRRTGDS